MPENIEGKFRKLMEHQGMKEITEERFYVVICHDSSLPEGKTYIYDKFKTKAARDKWYREDGREIEKLHGLKMERPEKPMSIEEVKE